MDTKLTLTIEKEVINTAKTYAREKGQTLSDLVENYFRLITRNRELVKPETLSPRVQRLRGIIKTTEPINTKETLTNELSKKYNR